MTKPTWMNVGNKEWHDAYVCQWRWRTKRQMIKKAIINVPLIIWFLYLIIYL